MQALVVPTLPAPARVGLMPFTFALITARINRVINPTARTGYAFASFEFQVWPWTQVEVGTPSGGLYSTKKTAGGPPAGFSKGTQE